MANACYNREPLKKIIWAQDGYRYITPDEFSPVSRLPKLIPLPDPMTKECQYSVLTVDPACLGCKWNQQQGQ